MIIFAFCNHLSRRTTNLKGTPLKLDMVCTTSYYAIQIKTRATNRWLLSIIQLSYCLPLNGYNRLDEVSGLILHQHEGGFEILDAFKAMCDELAGIKSAVHNE